MNGPDVSSDEGEELLTGRVKCPYCKETLIFTEAAVYHTEPTCNEVKELERE